jgi:hypothetical protein
MNLTFLGRDDFVRDLLGYLDRGSLLLEGARGIGKTRVLEHLEEHPPAGRVVLRFDLQGVTTAEALVQRLEEHIQLRRNRIEDWLSSLLRDWRKQDPWDSLESLLAQRAPSGCIVLLDEVQTYVDHIARLDKGRARAELAHLDRLRKSPDHVRFLLTGSITLRAVARGVGATLSPDWNSVRLGPLDAAAGATLFEDSCPTACATEAAAEGQRRTGGSPRWIKRLAQSMVGPTDQLLGLEHLQLAVDRLLDARPFQLDLEHLGRHASGEHLRRALTLAAIPGANRTSVLAGLQAQRLTRAEAEETLAILRDEFYLDDGYAFTLPLLAEWLRRAG